jgi:hypothetical protein
MNDSFAEGLILERFRQFCEQRGVDWRTARVPTIEAFAVNRIATEAQLEQVPRPKSWPKKHEALFTSMPRELQQYVADHERQRELVVTRSMNRAALAEQRLKESTEGKEQ